MSIMAAQLNEIEKRLEQQRQQIALERRLVREAVMKLEASQLQRLQVQSGTIGSLNEFHMDDDWTMWMERFEHYAIINNVDEARKISLFIVLVGPQAYALLRNLCTPELPADKSIMELDTIMKNHLQPTSSRITERNKFGECKRSEGQEIEEYLVVLKELAMSCDFGENLESRMRDQFILGLHSAPLKERLLKKTNFTFQRVIKIATILEPTTKSSVNSILDLPDKILVKIILYFNARERLALANSCQRFNDLVFGDKELLRNLDFTHKLGLTTSSDIQKYFDDENTYKKILGINVERVYGVRNLSSSIGKAMNLVELKILHGLEFESVEELSRFLKPLVHLKRLSVNWPGSLEWCSSNDPGRCKVLEEPFSRLTYLSLEIIWYSDKFLLTLQHCQQLEKLSLFVVRLRQFIGGLRQEPMKLNNLKFIQLRIDGNLELLMNDIMSIVPDPTEWTDFHPNDLLSEIYLERNVEVGAELEQDKKMPLPPYNADSRVPRLIKKGWSLYPEHLLSRVIRVTHEDAPEAFCCLSWPLYRALDATPIQLEADEAKKLLKDPEYQISSLCFPHFIEKNCDAHLVASAFPSLTRLFLYGISNSDSPKKTKAFHKRLRKKGSLVSEEHSNAWDTDSSFKMLVENTPHLEVLGIDSSYVNMEYWDLDALYLISGWKNLTVIRLIHIPMRDARFLIEIGKECKKLEEVKLFEHSPFGTCCYENELLEMLQHCKNLRKLDIEDLHLERLSEMFNILSNHSRLVALRSITYTKECDPCELTSSVEKMLRQCQELKRFEVDLRKYRFCHELRPDIDRVISESNRSNFEFRINEDD